MKEDRDFRLKEDGGLGTLVTRPGSTNWDVAMVIGICVSECVDQLEKSLTMAMLNHHVLALGWSSLQTVAI